MQQENDMQRRVNSQSFPLTTCSVSGNAVVFLFERTSHHGLPKNKYASVAGRTLDMLKTDLSRLPTMGPLIAELEV